MVTHEQYIQAVRAIALEYAEHVAASPQLQIQKRIPVLSDSQIEDVRHAKLVYGRGHVLLRGVTQFGAWQNGRESDDLIEVCALGQSNWTQLAGTTIHEIAHVAAGKGQGHGKAWKEACLALGLRRVQAAGTDYNRAMFAPEIRFKLASLPLPTDGFPKNQLAALGLMLKLRPCSAGIGSRGGTSRGVGSGSRQRKYQCEHGQIIRAATDHLQARCDVCGFPYHMADPDAAPARYMTSWDDVP